jgi:hypothetical protein
MSVVIKGLMLALFVYTVVLTIDMQQQYIPDTPISYFFLLPTCQQTLLFFFLPTRLTGHFLDSYHHLPNKTNDITSFKTLISCKTRLCPRKSVGRSNFLYRRSVCNVLDKIAQNVTSQTNISIYSLKGINVSL